MAMAVSVRCVTGSEAPLPTVMEGEGERGTREGKLLALDAICEDAPVLRNHSVGCGLEGGTPEFASTARRAW